MSRHVTRLGAGAIRALVREHGSPLLVLDCEQVRTQYRRLAHALPGVDLHYAVKALPHPSVIEALLDEGSFFEVSSTGEIKLLTSLGVPSSRGVHTHPIKREVDITDALEFGYHAFVVDNVAEMGKFTPFRDRVSLLLRIGFRSRDAVVDLAKKFGCAPEEAFSLLELGRTLELPIHGLSFHVGSQCGSPRSHVNAIRASLDFVERARAAGLAPLNLLDLGGGFPVSYRNEAPEIEEFCAPIREALKEVPPHVRVIAEPGRYLAASAMEGIATVVGKAKRGGSFWYYLDDGVYGSYSGQMFDGARYPLTAISEGQGDNYPSVLAGPTCDSVDIVAEDIDLPELQLGDLIVASQMGAYTSASASEFNSLPKTKILVLDAAAAASVSGR